MSKATAKATARTSPATLPRSQSHGSPGQRSVRYRVEVTTTPGDRGDRAGVRQGRDCREPSQDGQAEMAGYGRGGTTLS